MVSEKNSLALIMHAMTEKEPRCPLSVDNGEKCTMELEFSETLAMLRDFLTPLVECCEIF